MYIVRRFYLAPTTGTVCDLAAKAPRPGTKVRRAHWLKKSTREAVMPNSNRPVETELKLAVSPAAEKSLNEFAPFRSSTAGKPKSQRILTTYFDTPKYDLDRLGLSLRVRRVGQKRLQTVKTTGDQSAAKVRGEWEWPVAEDAPNLELARQASIEPAIPPGDRRQTDADRDHRRRPDDPGR